LPCAEKVEQRLGGGAVALPGFGGDECGTAEDEGGYDGEHHDGGGPFYLEQDLSEPNGEEGANNESDEGGADGSKHVDGDLASAGRPGFALEAEKTHAKMYADAKRAAKSGKDIQIKSVYICSVCGHTVFGKAPDNCPVCGVKKSRFRKF